MRLKLYRSDDVETAVKAAGQALGEDAMLISVEKSPALEIPLGRYRVLFANGLPTLQPESYTVRSPIRDRAPKWQELRTSLSLLVDQLSAQLPESSGSEQARQIILDSGVRPNDISVVEQAIERSTIGELLGKTIRQQPGPISGIAVFIGPDGSGKSTAADKLALREARGGKQVLIVRAFQSSHSLRPRHPDSGVLELSVMNVRELDVIDHIHPPPGLILIDTSSQLAADPNHITELSDWIHLKSATAHLVLSAVTRFEEWQNYVAKFSPFRPSLLLLTHMEEVVAWIGVWNAIITSSMECSFFSSGPRITDPFENAGPNPFRREFQALSEKVLQLDSTKLAVKSTVSGM